MTRPSARPRSGTRRGVYDIVQRICHLKDSKYVIDWNKWNMDKMAYIYHDGETEFRLDNVRIQKRSALNILASGGPSSPEDAGGARARGSSSDAALLIDKTVNRHSRYLKPFRSHQN